MQFQSEIQKFIFIVRNSHSHFTMRLNAISKQKPKALNGSFENLNGSFEKFSTYLVNPKF